VINPRPYDEKLDQESVPSKLLEYLASGSPILSSRHSALQKEFPTDINWLSDSSLQGLTSWFKGHLDEKKRLKDVLPNHGAEKVLSLYGQTIIGKTIYDFLNSLNASKS
jgi:hypothetical protein